MNEISLRKFAAQVAPGGLILYKRDRLPDNFALPQARVLCIPAAEMADKPGSTKVTNLGLMSALLEETECLSRATAMGVLETKIKRADLLKLDRQALSAGTISSTTRWAWARSPSPTASSSARHYRMLCIAGFFAPAYV
jgi:hypothetical protein